jgi:hypothetical protein
VQNKVNESRNGFLSSFESIFWRLAKKRKADDDLALSIIIIEEQHSFINFFRLLAINSFSERTTDIAGKDIAGKERRA